MKPVLKFVLAACPHCRRSERLEKELIELHPEYASVEIEVVDEGEQPARADKYDYYKVPCYFVGEEKISEGVPSLRGVEAVFKAALSD
ncbi:MAG: thioredoxin family protein [Oscillospiraceae bacterium]|nr:thioredoxin family protein [Oscillospiraceae bacterium]